MSEMTSGQPHGSETVAMGGAAADAASPPTTVGPYSLVEVLGQGGMGCVYKALHVNLKKTVAIKVLAPNQNFPRLVDRFYQEMEAVGRLEHPNLVRATDAGEDQGRHFLVMDYVEGEDLAKILRRRGKLPVDEACAIVRQAAQGLEYLAEHNLVHRDIKPSNLMVTPTGQVKILDLGLALLPREASTEESELTNPGQVMGTWDYMAPEQGRDSHQVDIRADIYSLGCTFFKMLTGSAPFALSSHATHQEKVRAHQEARIPRVTELRPDVPVAVERILERMLAKAPAERFQTPAELLAALAAPEDFGSVQLRRQRSVANKPSSSTSEIDASAAAPPRPSWTRFHARWLLGGFVFAAVGALVVVFLILDRRERPPQPGEWQGVMKERPKQLVWSATLSPLGWYPERKELVVAATGDRGILGLADVPVHTNYRFRVHLRQTPWTGNLGVVFGFRESKDGEERVVHFQSIGMSIRADGTMMIERAKTRGVFPANGPPHYESEMLAGQRVVPPRSNEEPLEIEVHGKHLLHVRWAGEELPALCEPRINESFTEEDTAGGVGVFCNNFTAIFRNAELMIE